MTDVGGNVSSNPSNSNATFLIVDADTGSPFEGMNGSAYHLGTPWPVINVKQNQTVTIRIFNCASSEPHGFAIAHYFNSGVTLPTGQSYTLNFVADQKGTFVMYCNTFCAIHPYMQDGENHSKLDEHLVNLTTDNRVPTLSTNQTSLHPIVEIRVTHNVRATLLLR